jgi:hypothetical protein
MKETKTIKVDGGVITFTPDEVLELSIDKKITKLRFDILNLETQLVRMLYPKDSKEESFLPPGNEIPFDFGKTKYEDMIYNINVSIKDLNNIKGYAEQINKIKK